MQDLFRSPRRPVRIVSLLPSATEIVCALGARADLVGISHECDFPPEIRGLPVLTRSRIDAHASSGAIDAAVRKVIQDALSIYEVDERKLGELPPDVIVTQDLCEVCAVSLDDVRAAISWLAHNEQVRIVSLSPTRLEEALADVETVASGIGRESEGKALIEVAGGVAVGASRGEPAPTIEAGTLTKLQPDVVVIKPCGFTLERTLAERSVLQRSVLDMVGPKTRVYVADGNAFFNRPGPRLVESLEIMAACVHSELFSDFAAAHADVTARLR